MLKKGRLRLAFAGAFVLMLSPALTPAAAQQSIKVDGSTGTAPLIDALGKAFTKKSGVAVEIGKGLGTTARFDALADGKIDIAMASHGLNVAEVTGKGMTVYRVAMTPVVFGVNASVTVHALTDAQICAIYSGSTRNWKEVGGTDLLIAPLVRPESEVDMEVVRDGLSCFKGLKLPSDLKSLARAGEMASALAATSGAIGMTSATAVTQSDGKIRLVALNGVTASETTVASGQYRLTRDAFLIMGKSVSAPAIAFIDFIRSAEGAAIIRANGAIAAAK